jgi:hypothetical protein
VRLNQRSASQGEVQRVPSIRGYRRRSILCSIRACVLLSILVAGLLGAPASAQVPTDLVGMTIVAHGIAAYDAGITWYFLSGRKVAPGVREEELTWEIHSFGVVRRIIKDLNSGHVDSDDTEYRWLDTHNSIDFQPVALRFSKLPDGQAPSIVAPVVMAIGRPGASVEVLSIGPGWVQSVQTVGPSVLVEYFLRTQ